METSSIDAYMQERWVLITKYAPESFAIFAVKQTTPSLFKQG